ncbi:hypothetical protein TWF730_007152 [Orbilia blumenaviensis]|uniref:Uncharacterized protein n=1 Tax=Orbilia blumenaviensis TaxID=1796055 RepID=A0AAV9VHU3_9PEZI
MMKFLSAFGAAACIAPLAFAKPVPDSLDKLMNRGVNVCKDVQLVVSILKLNKATPFCSTFLGIKTQTVSSTRSLTALATTTITEDVFLTSTETVQTQILTFTNTLTDATVPTTVATEVVPSVIVQTITVTPDPSIIYTTTYTTPAGVGVRSVAIEERGINLALPPFVTKYASSAISKACSCLALPTPTTTTTVEVVQSSTIMSTVTETHIIAVPATLTLTTTEIIKATAFNPKTITTTSVSTSYSTTTLPKITTTQTVSIPFKTPYCVRILQDKKLVYWQNIISPAGRTYYAIGRPSMPRGDEGLSLCCQACYDSPNCSLWK